MADATSSDEEDLHKATEAWPSPQTGVGHLTGSDSVSLPDRIAKTQLPADFVEASLKDRVRDAALLNELVVFCFFVLLFLLVSLNVVDIQSGHYTINGLRDLTEREYFPSVGVQNRSLWTMLEKGEPVIMDSDMAWRDIGEQSNWADWTGYAISRLFHCGDSELPHLDAASANVDGYAAFQTAPPFAFPNVTNMSGWSNATAAPTPTSNANQTATPTTAGTAPAGIGPQYGILGNMSELAARAWLPPFVRGQVVPIGALRLRAQLVKNTSCGISGHVAREVEVEANQTYYSPPTCYATDVTTATELRVSPRCYKTDPLDPLGYPMFAYRPCGLIGGIPTTTELGIYHCGGYTYDIPFNLTCTDALRVLYQLTEPSCPFVDAASTRLFVMEYFGYSPIGDIFVSVKHVLEITAGGAWIPTEQFRVFAVLGSSRTRVIVLDFFFLAFVGFYIITFFVNWRRFYRIEGRIMRYLLDIWTFIELVNVSTYIAVFVLRWMWWAYSVQAEVTQPRVGYPEDLERLLYIFSAMRYAMAFNFILTFIKMLKYLKISDRLAIVGITFDKAQMDVLGLLAIFVVVMLGYGVAGHTLFGAQMAEFAALDRALSTLMFMLMGQLDYESMKRVNPTLAGLYFWSFLIIGFFLLLNFIVAVVSDAFTAAGEEQFVAPLADSVQASFNEVFWSLRWRTMKKRVALWKKGRTQTGIEQQMVAWVINGVSNKKSRTTGVEIMVTADEVFKWLPTAIHHDAHHFFVRFWSNCLRDYELKLDTDEEQTKLSRQRAIIAGTRLGMGTITQDSAKDFVDQLERLNRLGDGIVAMLRAQYGEPLRPASPERRARPTSRAENRSDEMMTSVDEEKQTANVLKEAL